MERLIISVLVDNSAGVLERVANLIARRGFNIDSLTVGETSDKESRITILVTCDGYAQEQIVNQLEKQVFVHRVCVLPVTGAIVRELLLIKVSTTSKTRSEVLEVANIFRAKCVDVAAESLTLEITGETDKIEALIKLLDEFGIIEIARTGATALSRGSQNIYKSE